jgi:tetratricopeptide (TPR) repeat protein
LAWAEVHLLAQSPLGWISTINDTPVAVSGETLGPGDDVRVELGDGHAPVEAQAKHGLNAAGDLDEIVAGLRRVFGSPALAPAPTASVTTQRLMPSGGSQSPVERVVLVVDRGSSRALYTEFAEDLIRLRSGRTDGPRATLRRLLDTDSANSSILTHLYVVAVDVDHAYQPEAKHARLLLQSVLEDAAQAAAAWDILVADANDVCAQRLRRDRPALVQLLTSRGIQVRPPAPDERWMRQLDFTRDLLHKRHAAAALARLRQIETDMRETWRNGAPRATPAVNYRLVQQQAAAYLQLGRFHDARETAERALDSDPTGVHALVVAAAASSELGELPRALAYAKRAVEHHPRDPTAWSGLVQISRLAGESMPPIPTEVGVQVSFRVALVHTAIRAGEWMETLALTADLLRDGERTDEVLYGRALALVNARAEALGEVELATANGPGIHRGHASGDALDDMREAERLSSEAIEQLADETHPAMAQQYVVRSVSRRALGRETEADLDLAEARRLDHRDPTALWHTAMALLHAGRAREALALLRHPLVDEEARLLSLRASLSAQLQQLDDARASLEQLAPLLSAERVGADVHARVAETCLIIDDIDGARMALSRIGADEQNTLPVLLMRARLAVAERQPDIAIALYRAVAAADPENRLGLLAEAADALRRADRADDAVTLFEEAIADTPLDALSDDVAQGYATALMRTHRLVPAQALVDALLSRDGTVAPVPSWVLGLATEIAFSRDDLETAIRHLEALASREQAKPEVRIQLTRWLLEAGRTGEAEVHIAWLLDHLPDSPGLRMVVAELLTAVGKVEEGLSLAFRAFRDGGDQPAIHRAFVALVLTSRAAPPSRITVEADTHVQMRHTINGKVRRVTVFAEPPIDPLRDELSVADAESAGILGKAVDDLIVRDAGTWHQEQWIIVDLMPAIQFAALDAAEHFAARFPGEPFFIVGFNVDSESADSLDTLVATMRASLLERRAQVQQVFEVYRAATLPLGFVARATGKDLVAAMRLLSHEVRIRGLGTWEAAAAQLPADGANVGDTAIANPTAGEPAVSEPLTQTPDAHEPEPPPAPASGSPSQAGGLESEHAPPDRTRPASEERVVHRQPPPLSAEWMDRAGQVASREAARDATVVVLTRSAIETLEQLDLLPTVASHLQLAAPRSLREVLVRELRDAERQLGDGYRNVSATPHGLSLVDHDAGSAVLERERDRAGSRLAWLNEFVVVHTRPLETIPPPGSPDAEMRTMIGADSIDAVQLTKHRGWTMLADDLGLRRFLPPGGPGRSCSTISLIPALVERGAIAAADADRYLLRLVEWRYVAIPASESLLICAISEAMTLRPETLRNVFGLLAFGEITLDEASRIATRVLATLAVAPVQVLSMGHVTTLALQAMARGWGPAPAAFGLRREARVQLRLLPLQLTEVEERCAEFARAGTLANLTLPSITDR